MKKSLIISLLIATLLLPLSPAGAGGALPDLGTFDPEILRDLTWNEGTGFYDYVLFSYDDEGDPMDSYTVSAVWPDMSHALAMDAGKNTLTVLPYVMASGDIAVPVLSIRVSDADSLITDVQIGCGSLSLSLDFTDAGESVGLSEDPEDPYSEAVALNIGSNLFTLIGELADNGSSLSCRVTLKNGTVLTAASERFPDSGENPFYWLDRCLKECRLLDDARRLQESLRLYTAQYILHFSGLPVVTLSGAQWIDDLADSVSAYPVKLEYTHATDAAFTAAALNYSGSFGSRSRRSVSALSLAFYCLDAQGDPLAFGDGSALHYAGTDCALSPGDGAVLPFDEALPAGTVTVMAAVSSVTWSDGAVLTVPERDLVFVDYEARVTLPENIETEETVSL